MWLKDNIGYILGILVTILGFAYLFVEIWYPLKNAAAVIALISAVVYFYYGSSPGSKAKDETIQKLLAPPGGDGAK